ncbi:UNVERIFIED_CONTAM: hypothetical protein FKN15_025843 [Acipenser sinensis]
MRCAGQVIQSGELKRGQAPSELRQAPDIRSQVPGCRRGSWLGRGIGGRPLNLQFS